MKLGEYKKINFLYAFILIFVLWQIIAVIINKPILPTPFNILKYTFENFSSEMVMHVLYSLRRILLGITFTVIIAVPLGIIMGYYKKADLILSPIMYFNYPIPKIALLPVVMLLFGLEEWTKIIMIFLITFFPIVVNIRDKVKNIPEEVYYPMYSLGASNFQIIKEIVFPGIYSTILTSIRIGIGTAISILFFTENFGTEYGMGYFIMDSWMRINYIQMYSSIVVLSFIGLTLFIMIDLLEKLICPWKNRA
ncbi:ABC transporter permease [Haloimpatiens sp. FM7330]|uniref:ABC transporter permease n=1 Tax=Haloimpatiens sp. FM7330 TaxID=3298610 RepID=UPI003644EE7B